MKTTLILLSVLIFTVSAFAGGGDFKQPAEYPAAAIAEMKDAFASESFLSEQRFDEMMPAWKALVDYSRKYAVSMDNPTGEAATAFAGLLSSYAYKDWPDLSRSVVITTTCLGILNAMAELDNLKKQNQMAYTMTRTMVSGMITAAQISEADLKFVYDHWDEAVDIFEEMEEYADEE